MIKESYLVSKVKEQSFLPCKRNYSTDVSEEKIMQAKPSFCISCPLLICLDFFPSNTHLVSTNILLGNLCPLMKSGISFGNHKVRGNMWDFVK